MARDEGEARRLLAPLDELRPPPTRLTAADGVRAGRRSRTTRRGLLAVSVAALAVLTALSGPALLRRLVAPVPVPPAGAGAGFDPLRQVVTVGPAGGFGPVGYQTGRYWQRVVLRGPADPPPANTPAGDAPVAEVTVYPRDAAPAAAGRTSPAERVDGRSASWVSPPVTGTGGTELTWRLSTGVRVFAHVDRSGADWRSRLERVAASVRTADTPVRVPFTVPASVQDQVGQFAGVYRTLDANSPRFAAALVFRPAGSDQRALDNVADTYVGVQRDLPAGPVGARPWPAMRPTTMLDGREVYLSDTGTARFDVGGGFSAVAMVNAVPMFGAATPSGAPDTSPSGPRSSASPTASPNSPSEGSADGETGVGAPEASHSPDRVPVPGATDGAMMPADGLLDVAYSVRPMAGASNPSHWTVNPLR